MNVGDRFIINSRHPWRWGEQHGLHRFRMVVEVTEVGEHNSQWKQVEVLDESDPPPSGVITAPRAGGFANSAFDGLVTRGDYELLTV